MTLVVGIACWSAPDLELLDRMNDRLDRMVSQSILVEVFDAGSGLSLADIAVRVPSLGILFHTPIVGVWRDGYFSSSQQGAGARKMLEELSSLAS
jgi:hypothetical protein